MSLSSSGKSQPAETVGDARLRSKRSVSGPETTRGIPAGPSKRFDTGGKVVSRDRVRDSHDYETQRLRPGAEGRAASLEKALPGGSMTRSARIPGSYLQRVGVTTDLPESAPHTPRLPMNERSRFVIAVQAGTRDKPVFMSMGRRVGRQKKSSGAGASIGRVCIRDRSRPRCQSKNPSRKSLYVPEFLISAAKTVGRTGVDRQSGSRLGNDRGQGWVAPGEKERGRKTR